MNKENVIAREQATDESKVNIERERENAIVEGTCVALFTTHEWWM